MYRTFEDADQYSRTLETRELVLYRLFVVLNTHWRLIVHVRMFECTVEKGETFSESYLESEGWDRDLWAQRFQKRFWNLCGTGFA